MKNYKLPLCILLFTCFAAAILGDSTAESLLLSHFAATVIPRMFLVNAAFLFLTSAFMMSFIDRVDRGKFFLILIAIHAAMLLLVRVAILADAQVLYLPLFSYAYVSKIFFFMIFWTLVNDIVDSRSASKDFPFIAAGGTVGAILIAFSIPFILRVIPAENLILVWAGLILILGVFFIPVRRRFSGSFQSTADRLSRGGNGLQKIVDGMKLIRNEPLLTNMAVLYFLLFFVLLNQHYLFYGELKKHFASAKDMASFLGLFTGTSMFVTVVLQLTLSGRMLRTIGSTRSLFLMPAVLTVSFIIIAILQIIGMTAHPSMVAVSTNAVFMGIVIGMGLRIAFFDSFFSPNFQIFFSSLPQDIRGRAKLSLEGAVKPAAIVTASLWMMFGVPHVPPFVNALLLLSVSLLILYQVIRMKDTYTKTLTRFLAGVSTRKHLAPGTVASMTLDNRFLGVLQDLLMREDFEIKRYIIEMLCVARTPQTYAIVRAYMAHADGRIKSTIVAMLGNFPDPSMHDLIRGGLDDSDSRVIANSVESYARFAAHDEKPLFEKFLTSTHNRVKANALIALWSRAEPSEHPAYLAILAAMINSKSAFECASGLYAAGVLREPAACDLVADLYNRNKERVHSVPMIWRQFIFGIRSMQSKAALDLIVEVAADVSGKKEKDIADAVGVLTGNGIDIESCISRVLSGDCKTRYVLCEGLYNFQVVVPQHLWKTLKIIAEEQLHLAYRGWLDVSVLKSHRGSDAAYLLACAVREDMVLRHLYICLWCASFLDGSGRIRQVVPRAFHENRHVRGQVFEVLDNTGNIPLNRMLMKALDTDDVAVHATIARNEFGMKPLTLTEIIEYYRILKQSTPWTKQCADFASQASIAAPVV